MCGRMSDFATIEKSTVIQDNECPHRDHVSLNSTELIHSFSNIAVVF